MDALLQNYNSPASLVVKGVLDMLEKLSCSKEGSRLVVLRSFFSDLLTGSWKSIVLMITAYYAQNTDKLIELFAVTLRSYLSGLLYREDVVSKKTNALYPYLVQAYASMGDTYRGITFTTCERIQDGVLNLYVATFPGVHYDFHQRVASKAVALRELDLLNTETKCFHNYEKVTPLNLFPSKNYRLLNRVVGTWKKVTQRNGMRQPKAILLDGEAGLGKSCSVDALAKLGEYDSVSLIDMYKLSPKDILTAFKKLYTQVIEKAKGMSIVLFDELDKYVDAEIHKGYAELVEKRHKTLSTLKEGVPPPREVSLEEFTVGWKSDFLKTLLQLIEINTIEHGIVFIFCANNFDSIYEGVNMRHFSSLKTRFTRINFERCDKQELIEYVKYYNSMFKDLPECYCPENQLGVVLSDLREDISIPYRALSDTMMLAQFNVPTFVRAVNQWSPEPQDNTFEVVAPSSYFFLQQKKVSVDDFAEKPDPEEVYAVGENGVFPLYQGARYGSQTLSYGCYSDLESCNVGCICVKCETLRTCECHFDYFGFKEAKDQSGYVCYTCREGDEIQPLDLESLDLDFAKIGISHRICKRHSRDLPGCINYLECYECDEQKCICYLLFFGIEIFPKDNGVSYTFKCRQCTEQKEAS